MIDPLGVIRVRGPRRGPNGKRATVNSKPIILFYPKKPHSSDAMRPTSHWIKLAGLIMDYII